MEISCLFRDGSREKETQRLGPFYWAAGGEYRPNERDYIGLYGDYTFETRPGKPTLPLIYFWGLFGPIQVQIYLT